MRGRAVRSAVAWLAIVPVAACLGESSVELELLDLGLRSGGTVRELISESDSAVLVLYDPADCFTCSTNLSLWLEYDRMNPGRVRLLLAREPSEGEFWQPVLYRIRPDAVLAAGQTAGETPREVLVVSRRVAQSQVAGAGTSSRILAALWSQPV